MAETIASAGRPMLAACRSRAGASVRPLLAGALGIAALFAHAPRPVLVWNASPSAPIGLYGISAPHRLWRGDMVIARLPARIARLAAARQYLPFGVPLVKRIAAVPGDRICASGTRLILADGRSIARLRQDRSGRTMPRWTGCGRLARAHYLLVMRDAPRSFDGRYFGPTSVHDIVGKAHLLWAR